MDKLYTRRGFFRKAANKVLPVLLLADILSMDVLAKATPQDCEGTCKGSCARTCLTTCGRDPCGHVCKGGCVNTCTGTCGHSCWDTCARSSMSTSNYIESDSIKVDTLKIN